MWSLYFILFIVLVHFSIPQGVEDCQCVFHYQCNQTSGRVITDGSDIITNRNGGESCECGKQCDDIKVCCRVGSNDINSRSETNVSSTTEIIDRHTTIQCGVRNADGVGFKSSGSSEELSFGEFPWIVDILVDGDTYRCGGSLIHPSVVLTAAHCVIRKKNYVARAGDWDSSTDQEIFKHQDLAVSTIKIHDDYNPAVQYNDVALLFLNGQFILSHHIKPVCLSPSNAVYSNSRCFVSGRGKDETGQYKPILKRIDVPLVAKDICESNLKNSHKLGKNFKLHRSFICAGGEKDKDSCIGDGGGALVCPISEDNDRYQQVGIVSWGIGCHQENMPAVYTNVQFLKSWIDKQLKDRNIPTAQYNY